MRVTATAQRSAWRPILTGSVALESRTVIGDILSTLQEHPISAIDWGRPLLHAYLGVADAAPSDTARAATFADRACDAIADHVHLASLYGGFAGVAWLSAHLDSVLDRNASDAYDAVDAAVLTFVEAHRDTSYDLVSGLVGLGIYFVERLPSPAATAGLLAIYEVLANRGIYSADGVTWWTPPELLWSQERAYSPKGFYNLGVAHGIPGIIGFLAEMVGADIGGHEARQLLSEAAAWVLKQRLPGGFPAWLAPETPPTVARLAWCYGSLGVAVTLLAAARSLNDGALAANAVDVALETCNRQLNAGVQDAGLCHGSAGLGHLYNRLYQATDRPEFLEASEYWFVRTLEFRVTGVGVAGYAPWMPRPEDRVFPENPSHVTSFLTGATGIALALLAATSAVEPAWDRVLLCRLPPPQLATEHSST